MPPLLHEGQIVRNHRIVRRIGTGGMGEVYEAVHQTLQRRVAIKVLHPDWCKNPDLVKRFFNEALATNLIRHPAMVVIHDHGTFPDGMPFLIMEFLEGESMRRHFGRLEALQLARLAWQVATGLSAAHAKRIVHRDLKPDNIMVVRDDTMPGGQRVKILDFGLAKLAAEHQRDGAQPVLTRDGVALGTPEYMAPEQWLGAAKVDGKADVYSLGVVLYEALAGVPPFQASAGDRLRSQALYEPPPPLKDRSPHTPADLLKLIEQMLGKTVAERPSMAEVAVRLESLLSTHGVPSPMPSMASQRNQVAPASTHSPGVDPLAAARTEPYSVTRKAAMAIAIGFFIGSVILFLILASRVM